MRSKLQKIPEFNLNILNRWLTSQTCHQLILSPSTVTKIDVTLILLQCNPIFSEIRTFPTLNFGLKLECTHILDISLNPKIIFIDCQFKVNVWLSLNNFQMSKFVISKILTPDGSFNYIWTFMTSEIFHFFNLFWPLLSEENSGVLSPATLQTWTISLHSDYIYGLSMKGINLKIHRVPLNHSSNTRNRYFPGEAL